MCNSIAVCSGRLSFAFQPKKKNGNKMNSSKTKVFFCLFCKWKENACSQHELLKLCKRNKRIQSDYNESKWLGNYRKFSRIEWLECTRTEKKSSKFIENKCKKNKENWFVNGFDHAFKGSLIFCTHKNQNCTFDISMMNWAGRLSGQQQELIKLNEKKQ